MKTLKLLVFGLLFISATQAQVSVNLNLGKAPVWAPPERVATQYYYLPEVDAYYDLPAERFIYLNNGGWVRAEKLPAKFQNYNLQTGKVIFLTDYKGKSPYKYHKKHKAKYVAKSYGPGNVIFMQKGDNGQHKGHKKAHKKAHKKDKHHKKHD